MNKVDLVEQSRLRKDIPPFRPGDQVKVHVKVTEGQRERIQVFEGIVLGRRGGGLRETFTVRKISFGVGVERTFPLHGPAVDRVEIVRHGKVRRAKLYYLRERIGRAAKIDERRTRIKEWSPEDALAEQAEASVEVEGAEAPTPAETATGEGPTEGPTVGPTVEEAAPEEAAPEEAAPEEAAPEEPSAEVKDEEAPATVDEAPTEEAAPHGDAKAP